MRMVWVLVMALSGGAQAASLVVDGVTSFSGSSSASYDSIYVGETIPSTLNILDSASVTCGSGNFYIGDKQNGAGSGTVNVSGGTLTCNRSNLWIGWWQRGVMNISGGRANLNTLVVVYYEELNVSAGTLNVTNWETRVGWDAGSFLSVSGGVANLYSIHMNHPASRFSLTGGMLNLGAGGLYGHAASTLHFGGGTLKLSHGGAIAVDFGTTGTVESLFLDGVQQAAGTWGKSGSGADHVNNTYFTGAGILRVTKGPNRPGLALTVR